MQTQLYGGRIELICGPMFSGKSTELLRRLKRYEISGLRVLRINFAEDERYAKRAIATHDGNAHEALPAHTLAEVGELWTRYDVVGVDEGQFFCDVVAKAEEFANAGKIVIVASLDTTYLRTPFENIAQLFPKCEKVRKLTAICALCGQDAPFNLRTVQSDDLKVIGGQDMYKAVCRACYFTVIPQRNADQTPQPVGSGADQTPQPVGSGADQTPQPVGSGADLFFSTMESVEADKVKSTKSK